MSILFLTVHLGPERHVVAVTTLRLFSAEVTDAERTDHLVAG